MPAARRATGGDPRATQVCCDRSCRRPLLRGHATARGTAASCCCAAAPKEGLGAAGERYIYLESGCGTRLGLRDYAQQPRAARLEARERGASASGPPHAAAARKPCKCTTLSSHALHCAPGSTLRQRDAVVRASLGRGCDVLDVGDDCGGRRQGVRIGAEPRQRRCGRRSSLRRRSVPVSR